MLALVCTLAACDGGGGSQTPSEAAVCPPGEFTTVEDNPLGEYRYIVSTPCPEDADARLPAVIVLHGMPSSGPSVQNASNMDVLAEEAGLLAVYPTNPRSRWEAAASGADLEFISDLIDELVETWHADPDRIYVAGTSNGGDMTLAVGANLGDKVAGVAPVVPAGTGEVYDAVAELSAPLPLVAFTGNFDIAYGQAGRDGVDIWLDRADCTATATGTEPSGDGYEVESFSCAGGTPAQIYQVDGGHSWFGTPDMPLPLWASQVLWDFFASQAGP